MPRGKSALARESGQTVFDAFGEALIKAPDDPRANKCYGLANWWLDRAHDVFSSGTGKRQIVARTSMMSVSPNYRSAGIFWAAARVLQWEWEMEKAQTAVKPALHSRTCGPGAPLTFRVCRCYNTGTFVETISPARGERDVYPRKKHDLSLVRRRR